LFAHDDIDVDMAAEESNWNSNEVPDKPSFLIRRVGGAIDEFALFIRGGSDAELHSLD
jgi:hypothetical protein